MDDMDSLGNFQWKEWPEAEKIVHAFLTEFLLENKFAETFSRLLLEKTSTNLCDWVDHVLISGGENSQKKLLEAGYVGESVPAEPNSKVFWHPHARLPRIVVDGHSVKTEVLSVSIRCDELTFFASNFSQRFSTEAKLGFINGSMWGSYSRCAVLDEFPTFFAVQRRGYRGMKPVFLSEEEERRIREAMVIWGFRQRVFDKKLLSEKNGLEEAVRCAKKMVCLVGPGMASEIVMWDERLYWQKSNTAARFQKERQDKFGLGWANHDHHTFRSSRKHFRMLIKIFETLGFRCRERFHAGREAGWGAQILDHPESDVVIFADVDLAPEEIFNDFAHEPLKSAKNLGTIGLWCALHGESILQGGLHHLEITGNFDRLQKDLPDSGVPVMKPFSDLSMLRQAFTVGEQWPVSLERLKHLLKKKLITSEQFEKFAKEGAVGSHLEHLWRGGGYKGFNQKGINEIILAVDPRQSQGRGVSQ